MNTIHTRPQRGPIARFFQRMNVAFELLYLERDIAFERATLDALPAKVKALERHAEFLRVRQAILRSS